MKQLFTFSYLCLTLLVSTLHGMQPPALVADDINSPTCWINHADNLIKQVPNIDPKPIEIAEPYFNDPELLIRKRQYYRPPIVNSPEQLIALFFTHGTWGKDNEHFYDDKNDQKQNYRHIKRFATWYATIKRTNLELLSCKWTGAWDHEARAQAATKLGNLIFTYYKNADKILVGHSHGCNVHNMITQTETARAKPIDFMIHLACPRKKETGYQPLHYKTFLYFYSDGDLTAIGGRMDERETQKLICIGVVGAVTAAGLTATGNLGGGLAVAAVTTAYLTTEVVKLTDGTNDFLDHDGKITAGFCTKINGSNPGHSQIVDITQYLPEIIEKTLTEYPYHYLYSNGFHLNINNTTNKLILGLRDKQLILTAIHKKIKPPVETDYFVLNNNKNNILATDDIRISQQSKEEDLSEEAFRRYKECYNGQDMREWSILKGDIPTTHDTGYETRLHQQLSMKLKNG